MSDRVSRTILLCEDEEHERLVKAYMKRCGLATHAPYLVPIVASQMRHGGNVGWVLDRFPTELQSCRQRQKGKRAKTLLVVVVDADKSTVDERLRHLNDRLKLVGYDELGTNDPVALLIPRMNVETWLCALRGESVTEEIDYKKKCNKPTKDEIRQAADTAYEWARANATPGPTCIPSLKVALPEWRKIG